MNHRLHLATALLLMVARNAHTFQLHTHSRHIKTPCASSVNNLQTDPSIKSMVSEASSYTFVPTTAFERSTAIGGILGIVATIGAVDTVPVEIRLLLASILVFANFEYCFHRWVMHSSGGQETENFVQQSPFGAYQKLHLTHHTETRDDMQLEDGEQSDPRHIYFSAATTVSSVLISTSVLVVLDSIFHLGFLANVQEQSQSQAQFAGLLNGGQEFLPCFAVSCAVAWLHTSLWQTLHGDIHRFTSSYDQGLPRVNALSADTPYTRWMVTNHVGHHVVRGKGNFNIVFPGPDYLWGTCFVGRRAE